MGFRAGKIWVSSGGALLREAIKTTVLLLAMALWTALWAGGGQTVADQQDAAAPQSSQRSAAPVDLRQLEERVARVLEACRAATVHVQIEGASGSGVIVSPEGYVLTASHVSGMPERPALLTFADGRQVRGVTLGRLNYRFDADAGLIQITEPGPWPTVPMGGSSNLQPGAWCFALGYPGGYDRERGPVLRIGRLIHNLPRRLWTDCILLGGDSGGPLFDLDGRVIAIHSAIAKAPDLNFHAPVDAFEEHWTSLTHGYPLLGVSTVEHGSGALVDRVALGSAAEKVGLQAGDIIAALDGLRVAGPQKLQELILRKKPGDPVKLQIVRQDMTLELEAPLGRTWSLFQAPEVTND